MDLLTPLPLLIVVALIGALVGWLARSASLASAMATVDALTERLREQEQRHRDARDRHDDERRAQEARAREESQVLRALSPVQESLRSMHRAVAELEQQRHAQHGELSEQLRAAAAGDERLRSTTESLASALRNNSTRGVWGETQLRNVVESAGLIHRVDFLTQTGITTESGPGRPDMVVRLPGGKSIAVDAKVPYSSYLEASRIAATATGDDESRRRALLAQHAKAVRSHVDALATKAYWTGLAASPEFTIAFIPSEALLSAALEEDPALMDYAFGRRIALASPVNLWAVLKTVAFTWQQDVVTDDAARLLALSKELYGRLATLADHADKLGRALDTTVQRYNQFAASLESRVLVTARKLDELDDQTTITPPLLLDQQPRRLTAPEFTREVG